MRIYTLITVWWLIREQKTVVGYLSCVTVSEVQIFPLKTITLCTIIIIFYILSSRTFPTSLSAYAPAPGIGESPTLLKWAVSHIYKWLFKLSSKGTP